MAERPGSLLITLSSLKLSPTWPAARWLKN